MKCTGAEAIVQGLSTDGGLLTPEVLPKLPSNALRSMTDMTYQQRAVFLMKPFLDEFTSRELSEFAMRAYGPDKFDTKEVAPVRTLDDNTHCLELWHGPTCAFKDMALQMLPHLLTAALEKTGESRTACILVATSGDTGKGALEGFADVEKTKILVFYPQNGVSDVQELQMLTQEGDNVSVTAVVGNFADAQSGVKKLFSDPALKETLAQKGYFFSSANSINWGRVLPQVVYYFSAYCDLLKAEKITEGQKVNFCVPTGNFGNILAAYYAKQMGLPVGKLICASNQNNVLTDFIQTGVYDRNRTFYTTTSPSMDILISSNLERMLFECTERNGDEVKGYMEALASTGTYQVSDKVKKKMGDLFAAGFCDDEATQATIAKVWKQQGYLVDTHTAVGIHVLEEYRKETGDETPSVVVSTASPFKFCDNVLNALGTTQHNSGVEILSQLEKLTGQPVPKPLAELKGKLPRFDRVTEKDNMAQEVLAFLEV